jgi:hypothetical protein
MSGVDKPTDMGASAPEVVPESAEKMSVTEDVERMTLRPESKEEKIPVSSTASSIGEKNVASDGLVSVQPGPAETGLALTKLDSKIVKQKGDKNDKEQDPFKHLPPHEADILRKQVETPDVNVTYRTLFRYASRFDWLVFAISVACAVGSGASMPLMTVSRERGRQSGADEIRLCLVASQASSPTTSTARSPTATLLAA